MDKAITVERLAALGMTEDEAARALAAAGAGAAKATQPESPAGAEAPADPEVPAEPTKTMASEEAVKKAASEEPAQPEGTKAPAKPEQPAEPEAPVGPDLAAENAALRKRLIDMGVRMSALALGVKPERADIVRRLAGTGGIDPTAEDAMNRIEEAVRKALAEVPELIGAGAVSTGALGAHPRDTGTPGDPFSRGFGTL